MSEEMVFGSCGRGKRGNRYGDWIPAKEFFAGGFFAPGFAWIKLGAFWMLQGVSLVLFGALIMEMFKAARGAAIRRA